jgi:hypothetical protein
VFYVTGDTTRGWTGEPPVADIDDGQNGKRSFAVTLTPAVGVKWVTLRTETVKNGHPQAARAGAMSFARRHR